MVELFFTKFIISSFFMSFLILLILFSKKIFKNHISVKWNYHICMLFFVILIGPFLPSNLFNVGRILNSLSGSVSNYAKNSLLVNSNRIQPFSNDVSPVNNFTLSVNHSLAVNVNIALISIWITGVLILIIMTLLGNKKLSQIKKSVKPLDIEASNFFLTENLKKLDTSKTIILGKSHLIKVPMAIGIFKPYIILPASNIINLSINEINYIILHELTHHKNKDILINFVMLIFQTIYWFNPLVYLAFKEMRVDREIYCDISVLDMINEDAYGDYGRTLINFIDKFPKYFNSMLTTNMSCEKQQIKRRIQKIATYSTEPKTLKFKSMLIFTIIGIIILSQVPTISAMSFNNNQYNFSKENIIYEDLSSYFTGYNGSFVLYDLKNDQYEIYNKAQSVTRVSPDSTYKIYDSLIAFKLGLIKNGSTNLDWDGTVYPFNAWNKDQNLSEAIKNSVSWYFQKLDKSAGKQNLRKYFTEMGYGNHDLSASVSDYWLESSLLISPVEQVEMLKKFDKYDLDFNKTTIDTVKNILKIAEHDGKTLYGKTGSGEINGKNINGWFIGYIKNGDDTYFFATNIQGKDNATGENAYNTALSILKDKNIYQ